MTAEVRMDSDYIADLTRYLRTVKDIDLKRIPLVFGPHIDRGDPHPNWSILQERVRDQELLISLVERTRERSAVGSTRAPSAQLRNLDTTRATGLLTDAEVATTRPATRRLELSPWLSDRG